ncbi:hypothetical protein YC2023_112427 [Brassica napus]
MIILFFSDFVFGNFMKEFQVLFFFGSLISETKSFPPRLAGIASTSKVWE